MATVPESLAVVLIQNQTYLYVFRRAQNVQAITLVGGPTAGTWSVQWFGTTKTGLAPNISAVDLATALQTIPSVGGNGCTVTRSGTGVAGDPYIYLVTATGPLVEVKNGSKVQLAPRITCTPAFTPTNTPISCDYVPFDFTGWTMKMTVRPKNTDGTFQTTIVQIDETTNVATVGHIYIGYVEPASEGGTPGSLDPTNGKIALQIAAAATDAMTPAQFNNSSNKAAGWHSVVGAKSGWQKTFYDGNATFVTEPQ